LPIRSLFLIDLLVKGEKGLSPVRLLARSPGQLMKIARTSQPVEIAIYELRDLSTTPIELALERVVELGGLADGTVEYALDSGERYVAWTGENPSAVDFILRARPASETESVDVAAAASCTPVTG
jgi:hypothetical protein